MLFLVLVQQQTCIKVLVKMNPKWNTATSMFSDSKLHHIIIFFVVALKLHCWHSLVQSLWCAAFANVPILIHGSGLGNLSLSERSSREVVTAQGLTPSETLKPKSCRWRISSGVVFPDAPIIYLYLYKMTSQCVFMFPLHSFPQALGFSSNLTPSLWLFTFPQPPSLLK